MADDVCLATSINDDRNAAGRHGFDRGDAKMLGELRVCLWIFTETRRMPEDAGSCIEVSHSTARDICLDRCRIALCAGADKFKVFVVLSSGVQTADARVRPPRQPRV